jgi:O-antigen/teichoic acid export membrane protein
LRFSSTIILSTDSVVIGAFLSASAITIFSLASMPCMYGEGVISAIAHLVAPRVSALDAADGRGAVGAMVLRAGRAATLVILPITITFVLRGARFIDLWMGPEYGPLSGPLLQPLAIALTFAAASHINGSALMGLNRHREVVPFALAEAALNLALSIYWIGTMGLLGVALGTAVPRLARTLIVMPWLLRRHAGVSYSETWREVWIRPMLAAAPFGVATWMIEERWPAHHLATYFAQIAAILPLMAVGTWFAALSAEDRRRLQVAVARHLPWAASKA